MTHSSHDPRSPKGRVRTPAAYRTALASIAAPLVVIMCSCWLAIASGCGTSFENAAVQAGAAGGRTLIDLWLTELANQLADQLAGDGSADNGNDNGGMFGGDLTPLVGDPVNGQALWQANPCMSCHCADASGGCQLDAPNIQMVDRFTIDLRTRGPISHPGGKYNFSDQDVVDLEAYIMSLAPDDQANDNSLTPDDQANDNQDAP